MACKVAQTGLWVHVCLHSQLRLASCADKPEILPVRGGNTSPPTRAAAKVKGEGRIGGEKGARGWRQGRRGGNRGRTRERKRRLPASRSTFSTQLKARGDGARIAHQPSGGDGGGEVAALAVEHRQVLVRHGQQPVLRHGVSESRVFPSHDPIRVKASIA